eukprot:1324099-Amphidinium_carterae.1
MENWIMGHAGMVMKAFKTILPKQWQTSHIAFLLPLGGRRSWHRRHVLLSRGISGFKAPIAVVGGAYASSSTAKFCKEACGQELCHGSQQHCMKLSCGAL